MNHNYTLDEDYDEVLCKNLKSGDYIWWDDCLLKVTENYGPVDFFGSFHFGRGHILMFPENRFWHKSWIFDRWLNGTKDKRSEYFSENFPFLKLKDELI